MKQRNAKSQISSVLFFFLGVHRQFLLATIGWFIGYHLTKYENYMYAKLDRDMNEYIRLHPEEFAAKGKLIFSDLVQQQTTFLQKSAKGSTIIIIHPVSVQSSSFYWTSLVVQVVPYCLQCLTYNWTFMPSQKTLIYMVAYVSVLSNCSCLFYFTRKKDLCRDC